MGRYLFLLLLLAARGAQAQTDTLDAQRGGLHVKALREGKATYAVFFEDSMGKRISAADLWDRQLQLFDSAGQRWYRFSWQVWRRDSLIMDVISAGQLPLMKPLRHDAWYSGRGRKAFAFADTVVTVSEDTKRSARDSAFRVSLQPHGFIFPMDLELFPLVPFRRVGQQLAMAFYEPGTPRASYYPLSVTGREDLVLPGGAKVRCWLLRIDYGRGVHATFWISDKTREVLKMKEYFGGRYRYKVRLF